MQRTEIEAGLDPSPRERDRCEGPGNLPPRILPRPNRDDPEPFLLLVRGQGNPEPKESDQGLPLAMDLPTGLLPKAGSFERLADPRRGSEVHPNRLVTSPDHRHRQHSVEQVAPRSHELGPKLAASRRIERRDESVREAQGSTCARRDLDPKEAVLLVDLRLEILQEAPDEPMEIRSTHGRASSERPPRRLMFLSLTPS